MHHIQDPENILFKLSAAYTEGGALDMVGVSNEDSTVCGRPHTLPNQGQDCAVVRIMPGAIVALHGCDKPGPAQVVKAKRLHASTRLLGSEVIRKCWS